MGCRSSAPLGRDIASALCVAGPAMFTRVGHNVGVTTAPTEQAESQGLLLRLMDPANRSWRRPCVTTRPRNLSAELPPTT